MDLGIASRVALVTGASRGIGRACALALAREGACVAVGARDANALAGCVDEITRETGAEAMAVSLDLTDAQSVTAAVEAIRRRWGPIEILVVNGPGPASGPFESIEVEQWQEALDINVVAAVRLLHLVLPEMRDRGWGRIVFVTTVGVKIAQPNMVLSNATRLAVVGLAKTLMLELGDSGVLVNVVAPGPIETDRMVELIGDTARRDGISRDEAEDVWLEEVPLGRMGRPGDVASMVALLCSNICSYVTGAVIPVDGGKDRGY